MPPLHRQSFSLAIDLPWGAVLLDSLLKCLLRCTTPGYGRYCLPDGFGRFIHCLLAHKQNFLRYTELPAQLGVQQEFGHSDFELKE